MNECNCVDLIWQSFFAGALAVAAPLLLVGALWRLFVLEPPPADDELD